MTDVMVPSLGESVTEATVSTWFKKPGDVVKVDEMLCELETDKVSVEVPSPVAGVLAEIIAPEGTTVPYPPFCGGYALLPDEMEFWQGRPSRLHDRIHYKLDGSTWQINRLAP